MTSGPPAPAPASADPVLARYAESLRPSRRRYALVVGVVLALIAAGVTAAWLTGEERATTLVTATGPEPAVPNEPLGPALSVAWVSDDATAGGSTKTQGTVVTYDEHSVHGRDAVTGDVRWSYTRSDVTVCDVVTQDGVAVALFDKNGNCDQIVGLDAATGERRYNRTLYDSGSTSTMTSRGGSVMIVAEASVHVLSPGFDAGNVPSGGLDRWYWAPENCTVDSAQLGGRGVLAHIDCDGAPQLVLRKPYEDAEIWSVTDTAQPLLVTDAAALAWDSELSAIVSYALDTNTRVATAELPGCTDPVASEVAGMAMVLCGGTLHAFTAAGNSLAQVWSMPAIALPAVQSTTEQTAGQMVVIGADGARTVAASTGATTGTASALPVEAQTAVAAARRVERNGSGLLVAGRSTMMLGGAG